MVFDQAVGFESINTTQNGNLINSKYVLNSLLKGTLEQNKCIWYKPH